MSSVFRGSITLLLLAAISASTGLAEPVAPPDPSNAPHTVAGEPAHGRLEPLGVLVGHTYAVPTLIEGMEYQDADTRARCCFLLGQIASREASDVLEAALEDPSRTVRLFAGMALARMGETSGIPAARAAYLGQRWWIRYWAVDALARVGRVPQAALDDPDPLVRKLAKAGDLDAWGPVEVETTYAGPADQDLSQVIFTMANYLIGETDWWWHAGHYDQIIRGLETTVWLEPSYLEGLTNAAYLYWSLDRDTEALATYRRAVAMHPDEWLSHFELGFYYFNARKRPGDAVPEFERARELGCPPEAARLHAHALEHAGFPEKALAVWQELLAENPRDGVAHQNIKRLKAIVGSG